MAKNDSRWETLWAEAVEAGAAAIAACTPAPMIVSEHENPLDDNSPVRQSWFVASGVCGFAWVVISPGGSSFARWLKKNAGASKHYYGGIEVWPPRLPSGYEQSMEMKQAWAGAVARVLRAAGIKAYPGSRMD
jgi:hypothetical protein